MDNSDQKEVKEDVDYRGEDKIVQRMAAVPDGIHYAHHDVVENGEDHTKRVDTEVAYALREHILRSLHPPKYKRGEYGTENDKDSTSDYAECNIGMDCPPQLLHIPGTEISCDDNACSDGHSIEETDHHVYQGRRG